MPADGHAQRHLWQYDILASYFLLSYRLRLPLVACNCNYTCSCHAVSATGSRDDLSLLQYSCTPSPLRLPVGAGNGKDRNEKLRTNMPPLSQVGGHMHGLTAMITGPTNGIGLETALELGRRGANVILACRDRKRGEELALKVAAAQKAAGHVAKVRVVGLDLSSLESVESCAAEVTSSGQSLHILINNAGIFDMGGRRRQTSDQFEQHIGTNHLGHFSLTLRLLPLLRASASESALGARIINVSSLLHILGRLKPTDMHMLKQRYNATMAYGSSKCAQVLFTRTLRQLVASEPVHVFAVHPGEVLSNISRRSIPRWAFRLQLIIMPLFLFTTQEGARASMYCASDMDAPRIASQSEGYIGSNCKAEQPATCARNDKFGAFLWQWSVSQTKIPENLDPFDADQALGKGPARS